MGILANIGTMIIQLKTEGANQVEKDLNNATRSLQKTSQKMKEAGYTSLFTLGTITRAAGALGAVAVAFSSPVLFSYVTEFGYILASIGDTLGTILSPFLDILLDGLWGLSEWFEGQAPALSAMFAPLIPAWRTFVDLLVLVGKTILPMIVNALFGGVIAVSEFFTAIVNKDWKGAWDAVKYGFTVVLGLFSPLISPILKVIWEAIKNTDWKGAWTWLAKKLDDVWQYVIKPALPTWLTDFLSWMHKFFEGSAMTKLQMIGELIVAGMDWVKLGIIAAVKFWNSFVDKIISLAPSWLKPALGGLQIGGFFIEKGGGVVGVSPTIAAAIQEKGSMRYAALAEGGPVIGGTPYIVGESGPELFIPKSNGSITPNNQVGSYGGQTITLINKVELDGRQVWESIRRYSSAELRRLGGY